MTPGVRRQAFPGQPGAAYCPKCGGPNVKTEIRGGVEVFVSHTRFGCTVPCYRGSHQPVERVRR